MRRRREQPAAGSRGTPYNRGGRMSSLLLRPLHSVRLPGSQRVHRSRRVQRRRSSRSDAHAAITSSRRGRCSISAVPRLRLITCASRSAASSIARVRLRMSVASVCQNTLIDEDLGVGHLLADRRGHCGAVAEAIDVVVDERPVLAYPDPAGDTSDVRMQRVDAAVDHARCGRLCRSGPKETSAWLSRTTARTRRRAPASRRGAPSSTIPLAAEDAARGPRRSASAMAVRDQQRRASAHDALVAGRHLTLRDRIERCARLVQHQRRSD